MPIMRWVGRVTMAPGQRMRTSRFATGLEPDGRIVFLGDSLTEQGLWDEWFAGLPVLNRGVGGETVAEVSARAGRSVRGARAVSLLVGTNDLTGFGRSRKVSDIAHQYGRLVQQIRDVNPDAPLLLTSVLPRDRLSARRVVQLNEAIRDVAAQDRTSYVDAWQRLAGPDGQLRREFTMDRVHLTAQGYREWLAVLRPALALALDVGAR